MNWIALNELLIIDEEWGIDIVIAQDPMQVGPVTTLVFTRAWAGRNDLDLS